MRYLHLYITILKIFWVHGDDTGFDFADTRGYSNYIVTSLCNAYEGQKFERLLAPSEEARKEILKCIWVFTSRTNLQDANWATSCSRSEVMPPNFALLTSNDTNLENEANPGIKGEDNDTGRSGILPGYNNKTRWPRATMVYLADPKFTPKDVAYMALSFFDLRFLTGFCLNFRKKQNYDDDYVAIHKDGFGCDSKVGRQGGRQDLYLGKGCIYPSIITHELIHAWGFYHEHCRQDRNKYVKVLWENIEEGKDGNFYIKPGTLTYDLSYDFRSIMHYAKDAFSDNKMDTMEPRDPKNKSPFGGPVMTPSDQLKLTKMYCTVHNG